MEHGPIASPLATVGAVHPVRLSRGQRVMVDHAARLMAESPRPRDRAAAAELQALSLEWAAHQARADAAPARRSQRIILDLLARSRALVGAHQED